MEQMTSFWVSKVSMSGFRGFSDTVTYPCGPTTRIMGTNGQGKSSIGEAIAFAITGVTFFGEARLDQLYHQGSRDLAVDMTLVDGKGVFHRLYRQRTNDVMAITFDGMQARQKDLDFMFGERDVFLSIFNPLYFIEVLGDTGGALLERYLPAIPEANIMERLDDRDRETIEGIDMISPAGFLKKTRSDVKSMGERTTYLRGQRDVLVKQEDARADALAQARGTRDTAATRLKELKEKQSDGCSSGEIKGKLPGLYARLGEVAREKNGADTAELDKQIAEVTSKLEQIAARAYQSKYTQALAEAGAAVSQVHEEYARAKTVLNGLQPGVKCPTCLQTVTTENIVAIRDEWQKVTTEIVERGKGLAANRDEIKALDAEALAVFEKFSADDAAQAETQLRELQEQRASLAAPEVLAQREAEETQLAAEIQELEDALERGGLNQEEWAELTSLTAALPQMESAVERLEKESDRTAADIDAEISELVQQCAAKERQMEVADKYLSIKAELQFSGLSLNKVAISLYDVVKGTGERKDVFKFTFDGKPYKVLSQSERIRAGLEVSVLMQQILGLCYPVFIDNAEGIDVIDNVQPLGQYFSAEVVKGAPLQVVASNLPADSESAPTAA